MPEHSSRQAQVFPDRQVAGGGHHGAGVAQVAGHRRVGYSEDGLEQNAFERRDLVVAGIEHQSEAGGSVPCRDADRGVHSRSRVAAQQAGAGERVDAPALEVKARQDPQTRDDSPLQFAAEKETVAIRLVEEWLRVGDVVVVELRGVSDPKVVLAGSSLCIESQAEAPARKKIGEQRIQADVLAAGGRDLPIDCDGRAVGWWFIPITEARRPKLHVVQAHGEAVLRRIKDLGVPDIDPARAERRQVGNLCRARAGNSKQGQRDEERWPHPSRSKRYAVSWIAALSPSKAAYRAGYMEPAPNSPSLFTA